MEAGKTKTLGVYNPNGEENRAFIEFTKHFQKFKLPVPVIYDVDYGKQIYLVSDLGDTTLLDIVENEIRYGINLGRKFS